MKTLVKILDKDATAWFLGITGLLFIAFLVLLKFVFVAALFYIVIRIAWCMFTGCALLPF